MEENKKYILTKLVHAKPMMSSEYNSGLKTARLRLPIYPTKLLRNNQPGYLVTFQDGEEYWMEKKLFESITLEVNDNKHLPSSINVSEQMVDEFIDSYDILTVGYKTTVAKTILKNGFEIITSSGAIDELNYDVNRGEECCLEKAKKIIWGYLGFLLQTAWKGFRN